VIKVRLECRVYRYILKQKTCLAKLRTARNDAELDDPCEIEKTRVCARNPTI